MLGRVLDALIGVLPPDYHDAAFVADVLWLAAASGQLGASAGVPPAAPDAPPPEAAGSAMPPATPGNPAASEPPRGFANREGGGRRGSYGLYENLTEQEDAGYGGAVSVASGRALPQAVELARSLRPFMRRFPQGRRSGLDLTATIDSYSRGGELLPVIGPLPERWFDVLLVVDTHLSMEVWLDAVEEFAALLENSGAFRQIQRWRLSTEPHPYVTDSHGRLVRSHNVTSADGRRLVLVVSDCVAPAWYGAEVWQMLRDWAGRGSLSIANPLPSRLWHRTALDLPAVRVRNRLPGERNTALTFTVPPHLQSMMTDAKRYVAVPTLTLTAHSLQRWARGLVRCAPEGYEAVLVTPFGAPESPFAEEPGIGQKPRSPFPAGGPAWGDDASGPGGADHVRAFLRTASRPAIRLAAICSPFRRLSLPLIQLIRQEVVPEATNSDIAELLMSGVLEVHTSQDDSQLITFREQARTPLSKIAGRHDAWHVLDALSRYIAERTRLPGRGLHAFAALDTDELPESLRPFAYASAEVMAALRAGAERNRPPTSGGGPVDAYEDPGHDMPDPRASAALLIGSTSHDNGPSREHPGAVSAALNGLSALIVSQEGWNLPPERCVRLLDPTETQVREAVTRVASMADEGLIVYVIGHGRVEPSPSEVRPEQPHGDNLRISTMLEGLKTDHLVVIEDLCFRTEGEPAPEPVQQAVRATTTRITASYSSIGSPSFTDDLLRTVAEGVPSAPALLTADELAKSVSSPVPGGPAYSVSNTVVTNHDAAPAMVRNRASVPLPAIQASDASVERVLSWVRDQLRLEESASRAAAAAERVVGAFLRFLVAGVRGAAPPHAGSSAWDTFRTRLGGFLAGYEVSVELGSDFALRCRAHDEDPTTVIPVEVLDLSGGLRRQGERQPSSTPLYPDDRIASFALLVVLGGTRDRKRQTLTQRVTVARDPISGTCVVTLCLPAEPTPPDAPAAPGPTVEEDTPANLLAQAVNAYCASLSDRARDGGLRLDEIVRTDDVALPAGMIDPLVVSVRPALTNVPEPVSGGDDGGGELRVASEILLCGLIPNRNLSSTHNITVLAVENEYAFVSTPLTVVLVFAWRTLPSLDIEFLRVEIPESDENP
ncbi:SAV_2336 N-terminal domain-related protein [Streptomyces sp. NPDC008317]|uniref:SAV_2336 N-terminal domain-related protein n=1 Tax=Streptomyces sp. NPDC008317 TaxID=3364827 RepID=UPI0036EFACD0